LAVFERYIDESKRAIYYAQQIAQSAGATAVDSGHLLLGLLVDSGASANTVIELRCLMEADATIADAGVQHKMQKLIPLTNDSKRVLAYTVREANRLHDYWIYTEHFVLGILRDRANPGASRLLSVGLDLEACREEVAQNKSSRPVRRDPVVWWRGDRRHRLFSFLALEALLVGAFLWLFFHYYLR
jgi:ATP-dependent Clp protease ATP-binding subunit ClpA